MSEIPVIFTSNANSLLGIIHTTETEAKLGVLIVVGGPQYRVGSHRQFVLLARFLANNGIPSMRFDYRGMGDAEGDARTFAEVDDDIQSAINELYNYCPKLSGVVIWGLCDAASAALFYAYQDERVKGLILLNPWVFTTQGAAKTYLKHYYLERLLNREFWMKIITLRFNYRESFFSLINIVRNLFSEQLDLSDQAKNLEIAKDIKIDTSLSLPIRMRECLKRFKNPVLFILSGRDLTADEFRDKIKIDHEWQDLLKNSSVAWEELIEADHTFSSQQWRTKVEMTTLTWMRKL